MQNWKTPLISLDIHLLHVFMEVWFKTMQNPPLQKSPKLELNHLNLLWFLFIVYKVEVASWEREREREVLDNARKWQHFPKTEPGHADPVLPSILAGKRFIFFPFCNHLYYLRFFPQSLPPQLLSNPCLESQGRREGGRQLSPEFSITVSKKEKPQRNMKPTVVCTWNGMACTISFNKETSKFVSQSNTKIGFLLTQNHEDIYI